MLQANTSNNKSYQSHSLAETEQIARLIAADLSMPACVYLEGGLGTGKTTLCKTIIQVLGYKGVVTSPTYNLIQEYPIKNGIVYHMDLYRLQSPEELEFLAIADLWSKQSLFLIEWPEKGKSFLPNATHLLKLNNNGASKPSKNIVMTNL